MTKHILLLTASLLLTTTLGHAEQTLTLKDGSQIKGELAGIQDGVYTVKTPIIGDVHVAASNVANISNGDVPMPASAVTAAPAPSAAPLAGTDLNAQIALRQKQMMSNPETMADLQQMMQDPEIVQMLSDPALVQAVTSHDYQAIQSNPKTQALLSNPKMQALIQKLQAQQQNSSTQQ